MSTSRSLTRRRRTVAAIAATLALGVLAACGDDEPGDAAGDPTSQAADPTTDTASPTVQPETSDPATEVPTDAPGPDVIPVYYVGDTPQGDRLFREFTQASGVDKLVAAAAAVTTGDPVDPDYRTLWPTGRFASVEQADDAIVVGLADDTWLTRGRLDRARARLAVQQLVYTLQGTIGERLPVRVELDGQPAGTLLGIPVRDGLKARPQLDVLALVNITEPAEGSVVGKRFTASGRASSFEATHIWQVEDASGKVVLEGSAMAEGWIDKLWPWEVEIDARKLPPGRYTFVARTDDPSNGEGGGPTEDTKRIRIE
ncbi:sporulation and spore germination protein [Nocardioides sp. J9]|uniref:Gmad2 immunoglobulin-like domain-containing protein n=1 Tax=unclassified Nocardioides TaxID=2615069 RepID=UPI00049218FC|nr:MULTISPECIES: Gmad2 immunoglobulin-like domain-containing protein [unclassified Nocardioides]TWG89986.1 sporulation and spore germination protein [Nocardioides sp. J9]